MLNDRYIRHPELQGLLGLSRSAINSAVKKKIMPAPTRIGARAVAWRSSVIEAWLRERDSQAGQGVR